MRLELYTPEAISLGLSYLGKCCTERSAQSSWFDLAECIESGDDGHVHVAFSMALAREGLGEN